MEKISISKDFTTAPWARYRSDWAKSGQEFYEDLLKWKFEKARNEKAKLQIDMDGTLGYPSSFLSESFGRLRHEFKTIDIWKTIEIKSDEDDTLIELIKELAAGDYE